MKRKYLNSLKMIFGITVSIFFLFLAFRQVKFEDLIVVLLSTNIWAVILGVAINLLSHWFRAVRHYYLLKPLEVIKKGIIFSALMIGYMFNSILPAHLGEFIRAYVIGMRSKAASSSIFASIVVERVVDTISLLLLMAIISLVYPFPQVIRLSAYFTFGFAVCLSGFIVFLKIKTKNALHFVSFILKPLPQKLRERLLSLSNSFIDGITGLENVRSYCIFLVLTIVIWFCYAAVFASVLLAFDFYSTYQLPAVSAFVILIVTTIAIMVPSSPGYIGTYHWLCMIALGFFNIPEDGSLGYAIITHAISVLPVTALGILFAFKEGLSFSNASRQSKLNSLEVLT